MSSKRSADAPTTPPSGGRTAAPLAPASPVAHGQRGHQAADDREYDRIHGQAPLLRHRARFLSALTEPLARAKRLGKQSALARDVRRALRDIQRWLEAIDVAQLAADDAAALNFPDVHFRGTFGPEVRRLLPGPPMRMLRRDSYWANLDIAVYAAERLMGKLVAKLDVAERAFAARDAAAAARAARWAPAAGRRLVHVIAPSGAGKSALGERVRAALPDVLVVEVDDLQGAVAAESARSGAPQAEVFERLAAEAAARAPAGVNAKGITVSATVLFVGLTAFNDDGTLVPVAGARTYLLDVPDDVVVRQYYRRAAALIQGDGAYLGGLVDGSAELLSPDQLRAHIASVRAQAAALGAERAGADAILAALGE